MSTRSSKKSQIPLGTQGVYQRTTSKDAPAPTCSSSESNRSKPDTRSLDRWSYEETFELSIDSETGSVISAHSDLEDNDNTNSIISIPDYLWDEEGEHVEVEEDISRLRRQLMMIIQRQESILLGNDDANDANDEEHMMKLLQLLLNQPAQSYRACQICLDSGMMFTRPCCQAAICCACMLEYITTKVDIAQVVIECPMSQCRHLVSRDEINARLPVETRLKFQRFLVNLNKEEHQKTCPRCSHLTSVEPAVTRTRKYRHKPYLIDCQTCYLKWCFPCHAPAHEGISCKQFRKGDRLLQAWAKTQEHGQANARRCPRCKVFIQRLSGCAHMKCIKCKTNFCYNCGGRYLGTSYLGRHMDKYSVFGCKYGYKPNKPAQRRFIRGSIFAGKLMATPLIGAVAVGACALLIATSVFYVPVLVSRKIHREKKARREHKERMRYMEERKEYLEQIRQAGDPYLQQFQHMLELGCHLDTETMAWVRTDPFKSLASADSDSVSSGTSSEELTHYNPRHTLQIEAIAEALPSGTTCSSEQGGAAGNSSKSSRIKCSPRSSASKSDLKRNLSCGGLSACISKTHEPQEGTSVSQSSE